MSAPGVMLSSGATGSLMRTKRKLSTSVTSNAVAPMPPPTSV